MAGGLMDGGSMATRPTERRTPVRPGHRRGSCFGLGPLPPQPVQRNAEYLLGLALHPEGMHRMQEGAVGAVGVEAPMHSNCPNPSSPSSFFVRALPAQAPWVFGRASRASCMQEARDASGGAVVNLYWRHRWLLNNK